MLDVALDEHEGGLLFFYVSTLDLCQHMLWRNMDPEHPAHFDTTAARRDEIENLYAEMDGLVARVMERIPRDATLIIMSDHGFSPYYRKFNLNTWLLENGYIELVDPAALEESHLFGNVHWRKTKAYGVGFNGLYVNLRGRESKGIVREGAEYEALLRELAREAPRRPGSRDGLASRSRACTARARSITAPRRRGGPISSSATGGDTAAAINPCSEISPGTFSPGTWTNGAATTAWPRKRSRASSSRTENRA